MADFLTNLWESVFTPGTTPTLLIATNATFGALQLLLLGLLLATYSVHFAILSALCAGLWYSINWFAVELQAAQKAEIEAERLRKKKQGEKQWNKDDSADDEGEDTEVEGTLKESTTSLDEAVSAWDEEQTGRVVEGKGLRNEAGRDGNASGLDAIGGSSGQRQRRPQEAPSDLSTDSEWEKVDEGR